MLSFPLSRSAPARRSSPALTASLMTGAILCAAAFGAVPAGAATSPTATTAKATATKAKKKPASTDHRIKSLTKRLTSTNSKLTKANKKIDALSSTQFQVSQQVADALGKANNVLSLGAPGGLAAAISDPASGIPALIDGIVAKATQSLTALITGTKYAVAVVTLGSNDVYAGTAVLISPSIPVTGGPVTLSGTIPVIVPTAFALTAQPVNLKVGAVSLSSSTGGGPAFYVDVDSFQVTAVGGIGGAGNATLTGGETTNSGNAPVVWSDANGAVGNLPLWPVTNTVAGFQSDGTVNFNLAKATDMTSPEKLANLPTILGGGGQAPIRVQTSGGTGASILLAHVTMTIASTPSLSAPTG